MINKRLKIVFLSGAGVSVESNVPSYRDEDPTSIWRRYDPMEVCSLTGWNKNPQKVLDFFKEVTAGIIDCQPNIAHKIIAELEKDHDVVVLTQNVDDLHERAGSTTVLHIHGSLFVDKVTPQGTRPDVVLFEEDVKLLPQAIKHVKSADIFVVIGTSLEVYPVNTLVEWTMTDKKFYIDPIPKNFQEYTLIPMGAVDGMNYFKSLDIFK